MFLAINPFDIILSIIVILHDSISVAFAIFEVTLINSSIIEVLYSITVFLTVLELKIVDSSI